VTAEFSLADPLPAGWMLLEASAGTGKTYSLTALVARYVAERDVRADQLCMVTFTRAAAAELREETRLRLAEAIAALDAEDLGDEDRAWVLAIASGSVEDRAVRRERLQQALVQLDGATITTIHGFFQLALRELGLRSGDLVAAELVDDDAANVNAVTRDALLTEAITDVDRLLPDPTESPMKREGEVHKVLKALAATIDAQPAPTMEVSDPLARDLAVLAGELKERLRETRRSAGVMSFDDLITEMADLVSDPEVGPGIRQALRNRYRLVLIDETQDTDLVQWSLFKSTFPPGLEHDSDFCALIAVGDPKQAIYRFRGADVNAYLTLADEVADTRSMTTNWRSDAAVVSVLNRWLDGWEFGDPRIRYVGVNASPVAVDRRLAGGGEPVQLRWVPPVLDSDADGKEKFDLTVGEARPRIAADLANHVVQLLASGWITDNSPAGHRRVEPGDICVLVRAHSDAESIIEALSERNVPAVRSRIGSVLESEAVDELRLLLSALARPADARRVRALAAGWFIDTPVEELVEGDDVLVLQERCVEWARHLEADGVRGFFQRLRTDPKVLLAVAADGDAERRLTDLEHLVELLHARTDGRGVPGGALLGLLDELAANPSSTSEVEMRRIDTDAAAVQVTTMHSAKGLEWPVVLVPFPKGRNSTPPHSWSADGTRFVDAAQGVAWVAPGESGDCDKKYREQRAAMEVDGDDLRLLYVAMTRARHQLIVWWANTRGVGTGSLARLLFGTPGELGGSVTNSIPKDPAALVEHFGELDRRLGDGFSVGVVADEVPLVGLAQAPTGTLAEPQCALLPSGRSLASRHWYRWSYSSLPTGEARPDERDPHGGAGDEPELGVIGEADRLATTTGLLADLPAGAGFGTWVHEILEKVDFRSDPLDLEVRRAVDASFWSDANTVDADQLVAGLVAAIDTPLDPLPGGVRLRDVAVDDRLPELSFTFPLADRRAEVAIADIFALAADDADPMFGSYFADLASRVGGSRVAGIMTGSIDVVLRVPNGSTPLFCVADYKTNRLHPAGAPVGADDYGWSNMARAMEHADYPVQALLYSVALHRMLSLRLDGYDPDTHLGPACYFFVRGMVGADTPVVEGHRHGVFAWRPSTAVITGASAILGGER
jgi:exodeoxyribonuclease V beta subunit